MRIGGGLPGAEGGGGREGGDEEKAEGAEDSLSRAPLPVTCTSRVCLPASRSGSYLHSADEAATVLRRLRVLLLPKDSRRRCMWVYTGCRASRGLSSRTGYAGEFLGAATTTTRTRIPKYCKIG